MAGCVSGTTVCACHSSSSPALTVAVLCLIIVQLALQVYSLVDLAKRPKVQGGRKWVWALIIIFANLLGAVVYLAVGRSVDPLMDTTGLPRADDEAAKRAVDTLYGSERPK